ncbi:acylphosphatase [Bacillus hwajinpoensis]|uniref:acylphosphatase n=1 Tax=Guptibacillus hwajinpoensis TaxID=208199 RepID=A0A845F3F3_9BACL|nr:acylphosphatase [Pseudalkalibacillus hwajinpoensis]MYL65311.1 acylphosphatase [Pseudalkalibacillus hwajinpoensis]
MKRYQFIVKGRVQGVGFRAFTQQKAAELGLTGYVMNQMDNSVEIEAQGEENTLTKFQFALQNGSPFSAVDEVQAQEKQVHDHERSFSIRY